MQDWADRGEERSLIIVRILILTRNILQVPEDVDTEKRPDNDPNVHDQVSIYVEICFQLYRIVIFFFLFFFCFSSFICNFQLLWALCEGGMRDLIIYIASCENEQQYYFHILEVGTH